MTTDAETIARRATTGLREGHDVKGYIACSPTSAYPTPARRGRRFQL
jgi:hypothetical protein